MMLAAGSAWAGQLDDIKAAGAISFGTEGNYAPYTYHDEKGTLTGYDVEVGCEIAKKLGVKAEFRETLWDGMIAGLDAKRFDVVINQVTPTPARLEKYLFSVPYTYNYGA
ncbi:MAG: transporter substrate-binding domain-containing protein, partial [Sutterella sp.]